MFTVEFWAKLEIGGRVSVQKRGQVVGGTATDAGWEVSMTTEQVVVAVHGEPTQRAINIADRAVAPGWHHLAFSWDRGQSLAFLDGARVQPTDCGLNGDLDDGVVCLYGVLQPNPTAAPLRIGAVSDQSGALEYSEMAIDELRISNTPRYLNNFVPPERLDVDAATLVLLHSDEGVGTEADDASGSGHSATLMGTSNWRAGDGFDGRFCP